MPKATSKTKRKGKATPKAKSPRCRTCGKAIRVPRGWSAGPAVRRHYWAEHREVMAKGGSR